MISAFYSVLLFLKCMGDINNTTDTGMTTDLAMFLYKVQCMKCSGI